jgi:hypothetical protein
MVVVPAGSLDVDPGIRPGGHIFTGSRAPWFAVTDRLAQYGRASPAGLVH